jgi:hypothetical protein
MNRREFFSGVAACALTPMLPKVSRPAQASLQIVISATVSPSFEEFQRIVMAKPAAAYSLPYELFIEREFVR